MFDREKFKEKIKAQLKNVSRNKCVLFSVRSAMRILPLLAIQEAPKYPNRQRTPFWFWKQKEQANCLLYLFNTYTRCLQFQSSLKVSYDYQKAKSGASFDAYMATEGVIQAAFHSGNITVNSTWFDIIAAEAVASSIYSASRVGVHDSLIDEITNDLSIINNVSLEELLSLPLWRKNFPDSWMSLLDDFKNDVLSLNSGFELWLAWYDDRLQGKLIDVELLEKWNDISAELIATGAAKVNAHLKDELNKTIKLPLNRVRAIFIGYGEAGKTSLIRALNNQPVIKGTEPMTCGIEIRDWQVPDTDIQAHFWDFGGQVVFHSSHKFFLRSKCVYIIVINARADKDEDSEQVEYWLEHVKTFGGSAPVLIVRNKADEAEVHLQEQELKDKYRDMIKGFYSVSCTHATTTHKPHFEIFKEALRRELKQAVDKGQVMFTPAQGKVLEELGKNSLDDAFLSKQDFQQLCDKHSVSDDGELNRAWLVDIFDKLGVMLHFDELETYLDTYMLNPRWLTFGVYNVMNAKQARLDNKKIVEILKNAKIEDEYKHLLTYPKDKCRFISDAMQRFKLCYPLPNGEILIPSLLGKELPRLDLPGFKNLEGLNDTLQFEFAFSGFLPRNLIGEFMVSRYEEIKDNLQSQRGAIFKSRSLQAEALVEADYHRRLIIMQVVGRDAKEYLTILYDAMLTVFGELNLDYREWVNLPLSACLDKETFGINRKVEKAPYQQLLACARKKQIDYIAESGLSYDLSKVLGFILSKEKQNEIINNFYNGNPTLHQQNEVDMSKGKTVINAKTYIAGDVKDQAQVAGRNIINNTNANNADVNVLLDQLLSEIKALNDKVPEAQAQAMAKMEKRASALANEVASDDIDTEQCQLSFKGIKEAVETIGEIAAPIWAIAEKLSPLLIG